MDRFKRALVFGAMAGLLLPRVAVGADVLPGRSAVAPRAAVLLAQYDGPGLYGPGGGYDGAPMGGMDRPYDDGPSYGAPRRRERSPERGATQRVTYHGFRIDVSAGGSSPNLTNDIAAVEHQIDIVDSVGLNMADLRLFRSLPILVKNTLRNANHYAGGSTVSIGNLLVSDNRPVLLHEFMHVLHHLRIPGGFRNPEIRHFYEEAQAGGLYQQNSYMMSNHLEFFAVTASCYLYGTVAREPFNRETIQQRQPDYYAYLERLLGPARGSHMSTSRAAVTPTQAVSPRSAPVLQPAG